MPLLRLDKARESAPAILNVIKDSGWCYSFGIISVVAIVPVITFQAYELWKSRKDGWNKILLHITGLFALLGNGSWMVSDIFFHDRYRAYSKWIFGISWIVVALFGYFSYRQSKQEVKPQRTMMVSKQSGSVIFVHSKLGHLHKPGRDHHRVVMVRSRRQR